MHRNVLNALRCLECFMDQGFMFEITSGKISDSTELDQFQKWHTTFSVIFRLKAGTHDPIGALLAFLLDVLLFVNLVRGHAISMGRRHHHHLLKLVASSTRSEPWYHRGGWMGMMLLFSGLIQPSMGNVCSAARVADGPPCDVATLSPGPSGTNGLSHPGHPLTSSLTTMSAAEGLAVVRAKSG